MYTPESAPVEYVDDRGVEVVCVKVPKDELQEVAHLRERWACEDKPGTWGTGLLDDAVGVGLRGEIAFAKVTGCGIDIEPKAAGTGGGSDFDIANVTMEIKTKKMGSNHHHLLVRCVTENGNPMSLKSDVYIAAREASKVMVPGHEVIHLMGWIFGNDLVKMETVPARRGRHQNKEIPFGDLRLMRELLEYLPQTS